MKSKILRYLFMKNPSYFKAFCAIFLMVFLGGCEQAGKKPEASVQMRRIALCSAYQRPAAGQSPCEDGRGIERMFELPRNVVPEAKPNIVNYETWGVTLHIYVVERGLFFIPKPDDVKRSEIHTDTIFLHPTIPKISDFEGDLERRFDERFEPILDPERKGRYVANVQRDPDFVVYEYRIDDKEIGKGGPYPPEIFKPKNGVPIYFVCAKPWLVQGRMTNPLCTTSDFGRRNLKLKYLLQLSQIKNWQHYSSMLWQYIDAHTIPTGGNT